MTATTADNSLGLRDEVALCAQAASLSADHVRDLAVFARERSQSLVEVLVKREGINEQTLTQNLANLLNLRCWLDDDHEIPAEILAEISARLAFSHLVMPLGKDDGKLMVAQWDPFNWQGWDELCYLLKKPLTKVLCPRSVLERIIKANYGIGADTVDRLVAGKSTEEVRIAGNADTDLSEARAANDATVVNLVNQILTEAIRANATDIHFEPYQDKYRVRYRVDGMLEDVSIPVSVHLLKLALVSRIKIMSNLDITEKRMPQDGRCTVSLSGQEYDLRVSMLPGIHGEAVVIRLQSRQMTRLDLGTLGFAPDEQQKIGHLISRPHGLMLVTGPTGSGKTTTLYTCLQKIVSAETKIITIEDPVEYRMENILQMQVHQEIGFDFARALRSMLRHDPDIMLVGEIRDRETADIAIRSALTGHMVFATLHTNDAASAFTRLIDIGIEPFLVASSVHGILAQRLVRTICPHCKTRVDPASLDESQKQFLGQNGHLGKLDLCRGKGCERCRFSGYRGRSAVGEVLVVTSGIRQMIQERQPADRIKQLACQEGMTTLWRNALGVMAKGKTSLTEVLRVTQEDA